MIVTAKLAQDFFEIDRSTLSRWCKLYGPGLRVGTDKYDLKRLVNVWADNIYRGGTNTTGDTEMDEAKRQYWAAKAGREALKLTVERGELVSKEDVETAWASRAAEIRSSLLALALRLPPMLVSQGQKEMRTIIDEEVWQLLSSYSRGGRHCGSEDQPLKIEAPKKRGPGRPKTK